MTQLFNHKNQTKLRKTLRNSMPKSEVVLWKHLQGSQIGFKFRRQVGVGKYVLDFYCPRLRFGIEIDGITHEGREKIENDQKRQGHIQSLGILVKHYSSQDAFYRLQEVLNDIRATCEQLTAEQYNHPVPTKRRDSPPS